MAKQVKIKEIAAMAGVSAGTVDRILHGRGNVSEAKRQAVEAVLEKVGYKFNIHTSAVSLKRGYHFVITTPLAGEGDYWASVIAGITEAVEEYADIQILVDYCYYDQFDELSCKNTFDSIPAMAPDGVIIGPTFRKETLSLCQALDKKNIPYIFVDAHIEGTNPIASYSVNQEACGAFLGRMILAGLHEGEKILLFRSGRRSEERSSNTLAREKGLTEFLQKLGLGDQLVRAIVPQTKDAEELILEALHSQPDVQYAIVLNSRGHAIASAIKQGQLTGKIQLLGFDLTRDNIKCLEEGTITALLCQRPQLQGFSALRRLISWLLYRSREEDERHFLPIDLVVKENLPYYREM
ncbi:MAG: LacI family DNA-binding transcriptional regulator [Bacteroidales bacterium]|nr:LacI family DNA-binding transcriptional regulator [Bacteroidales bacterium]